MNRPFQAMQTRFSTLPLIAFCLGLAALSVQVIYLRAFLAIFYGNELSVGLVLALWLIWGGIGAKLAGKNRTSRLILSKTAFFTLAFLGAALGLVALRFVRFLFFVSPSQPLDLVHLTLSAAFFSAFPCLVFGALFAVTSREWRRHNAPARVYFFETIGSLVGGLITTFLGLRLGNDWLAFGLVVTAVLACIAWAERRWQNGIYPLAALLVLFGFEFFSIDQRLESVYWKSFAPGLHLVEHRQSRYGRLALLEWGGERLLYHNGVKVASLPDPIDAQAQAAVVLAQHEAPRSICLIGGGWGGLAVELLHHPHVRVTYCDLDEQTEQLVLAHSPDSLRRLWQNPRLSLLTIDARRWLRQDVRYDLIVCAVGAPALAQNNRYYTREFYKLVQDRLTPRGRFVVLGVPAGENYLGEELLQLNASVDATLRSVFPHVLYLPGDCSTFISAVDGEPEQRADVLAARLEKAGVVFPYFWPQQIRFFYMPDRLQHFAAVLAESRPVINSDFRPVGYYLDFLAWNKRLGGPQTLFVHIRQNATAGTWIVLIAVTLFGLFHTRWVKRHRRGWRFGLYASGLLLGYMAMTTQVVLLLALQAGRGYLYTEIGFALAAFMAGMAAAAGFAIRLFPGEIRPSVLIGYLLLAALIVALLPPLLNCLFVHPDLYFFLGLFFICGAMGGFSFPLYTSLDAALEGRIDYGRIYAFDLWGGALGAWIPAGLGIPLIGFHASLGLLAAALMIAAFFFIHTRELFPPYQQR